MSDIVLRCVFNNATARFNTGRVESEIFDQGGFKWTAALVRGSFGFTGSINFSLLCAVDHNDPWNCEAEVEVRVLKSNGTFVAFVATRASFNEQTSGWLHESTYEWGHITHPAYYNINDTITIEFLVKIISSDRGQPIADLPAFAAPNRKSDVILKIGDKTLHVSKQLLSFHSPVFEAMFFGDYAEKGKEEVEIKDVVYQEFLDLLHIIYVDSMEMTDQKVPHLLKLADRFQMECILNQSKKHLTKTKGIDVMTKLILADQYRLDALRDYCLKSFTNAGDVSKKLKSIPEYANFSANTKIAISDRLVDLTSV